MIDGRYGEGVQEPYDFGGLVTLLLCMTHDRRSSASVDLSPDQARLLGLRLIKVADEAEAVE